MMRITGRFISHPVIWCRKTPPQALALLAGLFLGVEALLQVTRGTSLCRSAGCQVAGDALRIPEPALVAIGGVFFLFLTGLLTLARWLGKDWPWWMAVLILFAALAFDGGLLGFQFTGVDERCLLCLLVGSALGLSLVLLAMERRSWMIPVFGLAVFTGGLAGNAVLKGMPQIPPLAETAFIYKAAETPETPLTLHLYFSLNCAHCTRVLTSLAASDTGKAEWYLCAADSKRENLLRLSEIKCRVEEGEEPFRTVLDVKRQETVPAGKVSAEVRQAAENALTFLRSNHYTSVPVLFAEEGKGRQVISVGSYNILGYLMARNIIG